MKEMKPGIDELIPNLELAIEMARVHGKPMIYIVGRHETGGKGVADFEADPFLADLKALASAEAWRARAERAEAIIAAITLWACESVPDLNKAIVPGSIVSASSEIMLTTTRSSIRVKPLSRPGWVVEFIFIMPSPTSLIL